MQQRPEKVVDGYLLSEEDARRKALQRKISSPLVTPKYTAPRKGYPKLEHKVFVKRVGRRV